MGGWREVPEKARLVMLALCVLALALALTACGGGSSSSSSSGESETTSEEAGGGESAAEGEKTTAATEEPLPGGAKRTLYVAEEDGFCGNTLRQTFRAELEDASRHSPYVKKFTYSCAQESLPKFISDVQSLVSQGVDILVTVPDPGEAVLPALKEATEQGVTVVNTVFPLKGQIPTDYAAQVVDDHHERGVKAAEYFIEKLGGKGTIVGVGGPPGNTFDTPEIEAMEEVFAEKAPEMKFAQLAEGDYEPAKSAQAMASLIQKYPEIAGVWTPEGTTVQPEIQQFITAGRELPVFVSNEVNGMMKEFESLKSQYPSLSWGFMPSRTWLMRYALELGLDAHQGKPIDKSKETIKVPVLDCEAHCAEYVDPEMPDGYLPSNRLSEEVRTEVLLPEMEGKTAPSTWTYGG